MATENPESKTKSGGGKLTRSETVTVRLDQKLRYLAELAARKQRRTVSSFIEWAVEQSFSKVPIYVGTGYNGDESIMLSDEMRQLWDVDESERFVKLAIHYPDLLDHDEQVKWKVLLDSGLLDTARVRTGTQRLIQWKWDVLDDVIFPALRRGWESLQLAIANGTGQDWIDATRAALKKGTVFYQDLPNKPVPEPEQDMSDDIPF